MTQRRTLSGRLLLAAILVSAPLGVPTANAAAIVFNDFSSLAGLQVNGNTRTIHGCAASGVGSTCSPVVGVGDAGNPDPSVLRLTNNTGQSGSAFSTDTVPLALDASFSTAFTFQITDPVGIGDSDGQGADGLVFVVQTVANTAGGAGGGIGYQGLGNSVGIEFDTFNNGLQDGNNGNHVGIDISGNVSSVARANVDIPSMGRLNNGALWYAWVDYNGASDLLEVRLSTTSSRPAAAFLSHTVDLVTVLGTTNAFVGFTSGTGSGGGDHDILSWQLNNTFDPIPEPSSMALVAVGLAMAASRAVRASRRQRR